MDQTTKKKQVEPKRKLSLHRETLRTLDNDAVGLLDAAVGGTWSVGLGDSRIAACVEP